MIENTELIVIAKVVPNLINYTEQELSYIILKTQERDIDIINDSSLSIVDQTQELVDMNIQNDKVRELEKIILQTPQIILKTTDFIHGKMYARTVFIPAGLVLTSVLTKIDNICVVSGDVTVTTQHGLKRFTGYHVIPALSGAKRAGVTHADTYWTTFIHTEHTDCDLAEEDFTGEAELLQTRRVKAGLMKERG